MIPSPGKHKKGKLCKQFVRNAESAKEEKTEAHAIVKDHCTTCWRIRPHTLKKMQAGSQGPGWWFVDVRSWTQKPNVCLLWAIKWAWHLRVKGGCGEQAARRGCRRQVPMDIKYIKGVGFVCCGEQSHRIKGPKNSQIIIVKIHKVLNWWFIIWFCAMSECFWGAGQPSIASSRPHIV